MLGGIRLRPVKSATHFDIIIYFTSDGVALSLSEAQYSGKLNQRSRKRCKLIQRMLMVKTISKKNLGKHGIPSLLNLSPHILIIPLLKPGKPELIAVINEYLYLFNAFTCKTYRYHRMTLNSRVYNPSYPHIKLSLTIKCSLNVSCWEASIREMKNRI